MISNNVYSLMDLINTIKIINEVKTFSLSFLPDEFSQIGHQLEQRFERIETALEAIGQYIQTKEDIHE